MAKGPLPLLLTPSTFMASTAGPTLMLDLKLALAFNRRRVPSGAGPLLDFVLLLLFFFLLCLGTWCYGNVRGKITWLLIFSVYFEVSLQIRYYNWK